jgi:hypothetical protein
MKRNILWVLLLLVNAGYAQLPDAGGKVKENDRDIPNSVENTEHKTGGVVKIYPNPAGGSITIEGFVVNARSAYKICDATGRIVLRGKLSPENYKLDVGLLLAGMYFVSFTGEHETMVVRLVKE